LKVFDGAPETLKALQQQEQGSWPVALNLAKEVPAPTSKATWQAVSDWLAERGFAMGTDHLAKMRKCGEDFADPYSRRHNRPDGKPVPFRLYLAASQRRATPKQRDEWLTKAATQNLTLRQFGELVTGKKWADSPEYKMAAVARDDPEGFAEFLVERPELVVRALRSPKVADVVVNDHEAHAAVIEAGSRRVHESTRVVRSGPVPRSEPPEPLARLLHILNIESVLVETTNMRALVMEKYTGEFVWRPNERETLVQKLTEARMNIDDCLALINFDIPDRVS
jgi:hypothetical protein